MLVSFYTFYVTDIKISRISGNCIKSNNLGARVRGCLLTVKGYYFCFGPWIWVFPVNRTFLVLINYLSYFSESLRERKNSTSNYDVLFQKKYLWFLTQNNRCWFSSYFEFHLNIIYWKCVMNFYSIFFFRSWKGKS